MYDVVDTESCKRNKDDRPAANRVGQRAERRADQKIREIIDADQNAVERGGARDLALHHPLDQLRQHRIDDADPDHVDEDSGQNHREAGLAEFQNGSGSGFFKAIGAASGTWSALYEPAFSADQAAATDVCMARTRPTDSRSPRMIG
jgi:hypothetical protein